MKLTLNTKVTVYKAVEDTFKDKSGKDVPYWTLNIDQNNRVASITCSENVAKAVKPMSDNTLIAEYDTETKKLRFVDVVGSKAV